MATVELKNYMLYQFEHHISDMIYYIGIKNLVKKLYITVNIEWQNMNNIIYCIQEIIQQARQQESHDLIIKKETEEKNRINIEELETLYLVIVNLHIELPNKTIGW